MRATVIEYDLLLTGGTSPLADYLVPRLLRDGRSVIATGRTDAADAALTERGLVTLRWDLTHSEVGQSGVRARTVLHVAGIRFAQGAARLAAEVEAEQIVAVSSASATAEGHPRRAEVLAGEAHLSVSAGDVRILRPTMIYGGTRDRNVRKLDALMQRLPKAPRLRGGGLVQPVLVDDVVSALIEALESATFPSSPRPVGGPEAVRLGDLVAGLARLRSKAPVGPALPLDGVASAAGRLNRLRCTALLHALAMLGTDRVVEPPSRAGWGYVPTALEDGLTLAVQRYGSCHGR